MRRIGAIMTAMALVVGACGGDETETTLPPELDTILAAAATAMADVDTVHFSLVRGGTPVYVFTEVEFLDAEGDYEAPDRAAAVARVSAAGLNVQIGAIAVDGETWITNVITGAWEPAPDTLSIDPALLFDASVGIPRLLDTDLADAELIGLEDSSTGARYHVSGLGPAERIETLTFGLVRGQDVTIDMWVDPVTGRLQEVAFVTLYGGEDATWRMTFSDYGSEVSIPIPAEIDG